jgi:hypothetical protein
MNNLFLFTGTLLIFIASPLLAQDAKPAASGKDAKPAAAGWDSRPNVNTFSMAPLFNYHFSTFLGQKSWYLRWTDNLQSYDWK